MGGRMEDVKAMLKVLARQGSAPQYAACIQAVLGSLGGGRPPLGVVRRLVSLMSAGVRERQEGVLLDIPVHSLLDSGERDVLVSENVRLRGSTLHAFVSGEGGKPVGSVPSALPIEMPLGEAGVRELVLYLMHDGGGAVRLYYDKGGRPMRTTYLVLNGVLLRQTKVTDSTQK